MGRHARTTSRTSSHPAVERLMDIALEHYLQDEVVPALERVNEAWSYSDGSQEFAQMYGRVLLDMAWVIAFRPREEINSLLQGAAMSMQTCPTGYMEVGLMASRIHLLRGKTLKALHDCSRVAATMNGLRDVIDPAFVKAFDEYHRYIREEFLRADESHRKEVDDELAAIWGISD